MPISSLDMYRWGILKLPELHTEIPHIGFARLFLQRWAGEAPSSPSLGEIMFPLTYQTADSLLAIHP